MPIKVKDHDKCKVWERRRRDRLNDAFKNLAQLLPHYDPAKIPPKIDILEKSTEFVKELRLSNSRLLSKQAENDEKCKLIKELQDEVNKLILRVKQLTILLNKAKITIPTGPAIKTLGSKRLKWSGKIKRDNVENSGGIPKPNQNHPTEKPNPVAFLPLKDADVSATVADVGNVSTTSTASNTRVPPVNPIVTPKPPTSSINSTTTTTPSIIIPLKETNSSKPSDKTKPTDSSLASLPTTFSPSSSSTPASKSDTTTVVSVSLPPLISEPIFTTTTAATPIQFPLQTIFLTPCSLTPAQTSQLLTRITLPPTILPRPLDSHSLQKIPIKQVLKPIPKVIKRRRKRVKKTGISNIETKDKIKVSISPDSTNSSSSVVAKILKESGDEKVSEKPISAISTVSNTEEANSHNEKEISTGEKSISSANKEGVSEADGEGVPKLQGKELMASESEKRQEEKETIEPAQTQNKILEQQASKASETEYKLLPEKLSETTKIISETGVNGEDAQSESIPVLRILDDSQSQINENSNIFSCVIIEEQSTPKSTEKTRHETFGISKIPTATAQEQPKPPVDETATTVSENVANSSAIGQTPDKAEATVSIISVTPLEKQIDKEVELNQNENVQKDVCMEQPREPPVNQPAPGELMETDSSHSKPSENETEGLESNGGKETVLLLPSDDLSKLNFTPLELEASQTASSQVLTPSLTVTALNEPSIIKKIPTSIADCNKQIEAINPVPEAESIQPPPQPQEFEQPSNPIVATLAILPVPETGALTALPSSSSSTMTSKAADDYTSNSVKQISSSSFSRDEQVGDRELSTNDTVTTDKISECIARSIDLIDANDSELMELGESWEDTGGSPKSPISPTQMFLNIFPLLPRESSEQQQQTQQQQPSQTSTTPQKSSIPFPSSSSRSSFFIDAMLPDDHSVNNNNNGNINEEMEMISSSSSTTQNHQCLALTPPQFSANISHSNSSSLSTSISNTSYYWNTASCSVESSAESYRGGNVLSRSSVISSTTAPTTATTTPTVVGVNSKSNAQNSHGIVATTTTATTSSAVSIKPTPQPSQSPRKLSKSSSQSKQNSSGLPSYANRSKSSAALTSTTSSLTWTVATATPTSHSFNVSSSQPAAVQSITQLHSSSVAAVSGNQSHSHTCSLLDALNPMDASFFRPLINALDSHEFRSLEFPPSTPLPPPLPSLIPPKPLYTPQFSSNNSHPSIQNQMSVNYHPPPIVPPDQHPAASIQSSIIHHHHHHPHHHTSMFPNTSIGNNDNSTAMVINQDVSGSSSRKQPHTHAQHSISHQTHHQPQLSTQIQPTPSRNNEPLTVSNSKTSNHNQNQPEKPSRAATAKQGKVESSSRQSRSGKSSRTQPYIVPTSSSACPQAPAPAPASNHRQHQAAPAFVSHPVSHTPYYSNSNINHSNQSSNSALKLSSASCTKNQHLLFTPNATAPATGIGSTATQHNHQQQHHYNNSSHSQPQISSGHAQATTGKVSETKSQRNKHEERSSVNQNQPKSRIYQNLPQQAAASQQTQASSSSSSSAPNVAASQAIVGNVASSSATQANHHHSHRNTTPKVVQHHQNQSSNSVNNSSQSHPFQFHAPDSFQLFPDFGGNMSRQFNTQPSNHSETSNNFNLQPANVNIQPNSVGATPNFTPQRAHPHPYYLPDISSSFDNFTMPMIPPTTQQIHSNTPSRQPPAAVGGGSSCNQNSKYMYGATTASTTNGNQQPGASSANRMPQTQPVAPVQTQALLQQPSHHHHHHHNIHQEMPYNNHNAPQHQPSSSNHPQPIIHTIPPHSQAPPVQTVPPPVRLNQQHQNQNPQQQQPTSSTPSSSSSSSKAKQLQSVNYPPPNSQQQAQHQQHQIHQHQQQNIQSQGQQQQQHASTQPQQPNRSSASRTVNWMTDTGYRTTSSTNANNNGNSSGIKQCLQQSGSTNNPFSVSKLVGITPTPAAPAKPHQHQQPPQQSSNIDTSRRDQAQQQQPSSNNTSNTARNKSSSSTSVNPATSNNQSNYCAEALIRKNPEWDNFSSSTNSNFPNYPTHHPASSSSSHNTDHFPSYSNLTGSYQYSGSGSGSGHHSVSAATSSSHFNHFSTQPQHFHAPTPHHHQQQQPNYHSSSQQQPQTHSHSIHQHTQQTSQIHYQHHQHHPHQTAHGTSTSSVSNFNLSTIFPEINDKRSGNNNAGAGQGGGGGGGGATGGSNVGRSSGTGSGNMNSFNYHHPAFPGTTGNSHQ